jgi:hypothetical protein
MPASVWMSDRSRQHDDPKADARELFQAPQLRPRVHAALRPHYRRVERARKRLVITNFQWCSSLTVGSVVLNGTTVTSLPCRRLGPSTITGRDLHISPSRTRPCGRSGKREFHPGRDNTARAFVFPKNRSGAMCTAASLYFTSLFGPPRSRRPRNGQAASLFNPRRVRERDGG